MHGVLKMRRWKSNGYSYYALGVPRDIAEQADDAELYTVERSKDGAITYTPLRQTRKKK